MKEVPDTNPESSVESNKMTEAAPGAMAETKREIDEVLNWDTSPQGPSGATADTSEFSREIDTPDARGDWGEGNILQEIVDELFGIEDWESTDSDQFEVLPPTETDFTESDQQREAGNPEALAPYWHFQGNTMDCALYAQGGILEAMGQDFDIEKYREQGLEGGWYTPEGGTALDHMGDLLEENGVAVNRYEGGATLDDLANELEQGKGVVVAVDCEPLWGEPGGHALWVTGIERGPDGTPTAVICNDSGRPDGQKIAYPYDSFVQAWNASNNTMVATRDAIPTSR